MHWRTGKFLENVKDLFDAKGRKDINNSFTARSGRARKFVLDMKHSKKMVLVPEERGSSAIRTKAETRDVTFDGTIMHKDANTQISDILQRDDVPDDEKQVV